MTYSLKALQYYGLMLLLIPAAVSAGSAINEAQPYHVYLGLTTGVSLAKVGDNNPTINYAGTISDNYATNSSYSTRPLLSLNSGIEFIPEAGSPTFQLGIGVYSTPSPYAYYGKMFETSLGDPTQLQYGYQFNVTATRLMVEGQLNWAIGNFRPFINAGAGGAWVTAKRYDEKPINSSYPPLPAFANKTNTNFAYQAGFGLGYDFNTQEEDSDEFLQERIAIGYRYTNLGELSFGTRGSTYPYPLNLGSLARSLATNDIYLAYTHFF